MRILVLNHEFPPIGGGGGKVCQDIARELCRRGHEVRVLTSLYTGLAAHEEKDNLLVIRLPVCRQKLFQAGLLTMGLYVVQAIIYGKRVIRDWKPQLIHVHFAVPAGAAAFALHRLTGIPYLLTTHLGDIPGGSPQKTRGWFRWLYPFTIPIWRNAAVITTVSEFTQSLAEKQYGIRPDVIPNGIRIKEGRKIKLNSPPTIIFAGRFAPQKNLDIFIDVLEQIRDLQWNCIMLGDGPLFAHIHMRVEKAGLLERISMPGWVSPDEVTRLMEKSDVLFMPSLTEGLPVVGLQALETGLAIVASNTGGFIDLVDEERNGVLLDPVDIPGFAKKLQALINNQDELLLARKNSLQIAQKFSISNIVNSYEEVMKIVAARPDIQRLANK
jgi:glycosyltransferase involved in cell wall biosynthesis